jgi:hypothetical protein
LKQVDVRTHCMRDSRFDWVGVAYTDDDAAMVLRADVV